MTTSRRDDRVRAAILAGAIGDAMGHATEFLSMADIRARFGPEGARDYHVFVDAPDGTRRGAFTDDTQMAELVLEALIVARRDALPLDDTMTRIAQSFVTWSTSPRGGHRAPGNACLAGARAVARGVPWRESGGPDAGGCGSVMRAYPFGLAFVDDVDRAEAWAVAHSAITHRAPIALAACAAMAVGVVRAIHDDAPAEVAARMIAAAGRHDHGTAAMCARARDEAIDGTPPSVTLDRLRAWAAHEAIAAALYIFLRHPDDVAAAIVEGANTPGDSDSIASIAGALTGARAGTSTIPSSWITRLERVEDLEARTRELCAMLPR